MKYIHRTLFVNVPGGTYCETVSSLQVQEFVDGLEYVEIKVSDAVFEYIAYYHRSEERIWRMLADIYPLDPLPDPRDLLNPKFKINKGIISYTIRRGHYELVKFIREHDNACCTVEHLTCDCHPGQVFPMYSSSLPLYNLADERETLADNAKAKEEGRRVKLSHPGPGGLRRGGGF